MATAFTSTRWIRRRIRAAVLAHRRQAGPAFRVRRLLSPNVTDVEYVSSIRHSDFIPIRLEALQDLHFDGATRIQMEAMRRLGRGWNEEFTTSDGTSPFPKGIVFEAMEIAGGVESVLGAAAGGIEYDNLTALEYGIDLAYIEGHEGGIFGGFTDQLGGMIGYMMNRNVERRLREGKDKDNRPLWVPNLETGRAIQGTPARINGFPYVLNQDMDDGETADDLPIMFGAFGHYGIRNISAPVLYRFFDRETIKKYSTEWIAFQRRDGRAFGPIVGGKCVALAVLKVAA